MAFIICDVSSYRCWNKNGIVVDQITNKPRYFETKDDAQAFCDLSQYRDAKIKPAHEVTQ